MGYLLSAQVQRQQHQEELAAQQVAWFRDSGAKGQGGQGFRGSGCRVLGSVRVLDLFGFRDEGLGFEIGVSQMDPLENHLRAGTAEHFVFVMLSRASFCCSDYSTRSSSTATTWKY